MENKQTPPAPDAAYARACAVLADYVDKLWPMYLCHALRYDEMKGKVGVEIDQRLHALRFIAMPPETAEAWKLVTERRKTKTSQTVPAPVAIEGAPMQYMDACDILAGYMGGVKGMWRWDRGLTAAMRTGELTVPQKRSVVRSFTALLKNYNNVPTNVREAWALVQKEWTQRDLQGGALMPLPIGPEGAQRALDVYGIAFPQKRTAPTGAVERVYRKAEKGYGGPSVRPDMLGEESIFLKPKPAGYSRG